MSNKSNNAMAFGKKDFIWLGIGLVTIVLGYILMSGGGSADPTEFSEEIFSFRRINLAPVVVLVGYGIIMYAILRKKD